MKPLLHLLFLCFSLSIVAQSQNKVIKRLEAEEINTVDFKLQYQSIVLEHWNQKLIAIELAIQTNVPDALVDLLVKTGRYEMDAQKEDRRFTISLPQMLNYVIVKGKEVKEDISLRVKAPRYYVLTEHHLQKDEAAMRQMMTNVTARGDEEALDPDKWLEKMKLIKEPVEWRFTISSSLDPELAATQVVFTLTPPEDSTQDVMYLSADDIMINGEVIDDSFLEGE